MSDPTAGSAAAVQTRSITVTFELVDGVSTFSYAGDGGATGDLAFNPGTSTITVSLGSGSTPGWALDSVVFSAIAPPNAPVPLSYTKQGQNLIIANHNDLPNGATAQRFCYQVVVKKGQNTHMAPDPKITNDPPSQPPL